MKILLSEDKFKKLFEAKKEGFRLDCLISARSFAERVRYCKNMLGFPIGNGSSRMVFQIDDETCLKLAKNKKGVAQNQEEIRIASDDFISYIPKVFNGSDEENGLWIITQYVIPAKTKDFEEILGISFEDVQSFCASTDTRFNYRNREDIIKQADFTVSQLYEAYEENDAVTELFRDIEELRGSYDQLVGDLTRIQNWGMVKENGNTFLVMLDTGFSEDICNQYYRRKW